MALAPSDHSSAPLETSEVHRAFDVWNEVPLVAQTTGMSCWAAAAAMLVGWRERLAVDADRVAQGAGRWQEFRKGLHPVDVAALADRWGLVLEHRDDIWGVDRFRELLETHGPLWVGEASPGLHAIVVTGLYGDGTADGTRVRVNDPWPVGTGERYTLTFQRLRENFEAASRLTGDRAHILHAGGRTRGPSGRWRAEHRTTQRHSQHGGTERSIERSARMSHHEEFESSYGGAALADALAVGAGHRYLDTTTGGPDPLSGHGGMGDNLYLSWTAIPDDTRVVDVVVHLHAYSGAEPTRAMLERKVAASGLDLTARSRPTLAILPRGRKITADEIRRARQRAERVSSSRYTFPALTTREGGGLEILIQYALTLLSRDALGGRRVSVGRLILTAHSAAGVTLNELLIHHARRAACNPHEVHIFDALYGAVDGIAAWARSRVARDRELVAQGEAALAREGGACRVLYRADTHAGSTALAKAFATEPPLRSAYRAETTGVAHGDIPRVFGSPLLTNPRADLVLVPATARAAEAEEVLEVEAFGPSTVVTPSTRVGVRWLNVVDENGRALDGEEYVAQQDEGGPGIRGVVRSGRADLGQIDLLKPFRFEVRGRVCAIKEGAVLVVDAPGVQYGGTAVNWLEADGPTADKVFWPDYEAHRTAMGDGPSSFWQHEHITRRPIRLRQEWAKPGGKTALITAAPVKIRVGPLVRFTNADTAVIWVETETPALVRVRFDKHASKRAAPADRFGSTVRVGGRHYAVIALDGLAETTRYDYTLEMAPHSNAGGVPVADAAIRGLFPKLSSAVLDATRKQLRGASFDGSEWLSFRTLRSRYDRGFRFAYGSCRKYVMDRAGNETGGPDALDAFQSFMEKGNPEQDWPRFILLVGDQIYADDVGHHQGLAIARQRWSKRLPGPKPIEGEGAWAGRFSTRFTGVSNAPRHLKYRIDNHLLSEIPVAADEIKPNALDRRPAGDTATPEHPEVPPLGKPVPIHAADFAEYAYLYQAAWARGAAHKVLANLVSFMVMDDHEVTDDFNFDRKWLDIVHRAPQDVHKYWPETITDALAAYWLYQGWGNISPLDWSNDARVAALFKHRSAGTDALASLREILGRDLEPPAKTLTWDYALPLESPIFYATDCRMRRVLIPSKGPSFDDQVLDRAGLDKMRKLLVRSRSPVAFVISSLPMLLPGLVADGFRLEKVTASFLGIKALSITPLTVDEKFRRGNDMEHWIANRSWFDLLRFLADLSKEAPNLKTVVALSGDVHFNYNMLGWLDPAQEIPKAMSLRATRTDSQGRNVPYLLQLVSSGIKQQLSAFKAYHSRLLVEDDAILNKPAYPAGSTKEIEQLKKDTEKLEKLRSGTAIANGLYRKELTRSDYNFYGMKLRLGGFEDIDNPRRTLLQQNAVAVVDLSIDEGSATFKLVERYVTNVSARTPRYTFELTAGGAAQTTPRF